MREGSWKSPTYAGSLHCIIADSGCLISCLMVISLINIDNVDDQVLWQSQNKASSLYCTICRMIPFLHRKNESYNTKKLTIVELNMLEIYQLKDTFPFWHTYFWPMQNGLVCLGILQTKFTKKMKSSGEEWLHNEAHSTSRIAPLIFQWVNESTHCCLSEFVCIGSVSIWLSARLA